MINEPTAVSNEDYTISECTSMYSDMLDSLHLERLESFMLMLIAFVPVVVIDNE